MDVEAIAESDPDALVRLHVDPLAGLTATMPSRSPLTPASTRTSSKAVAETLVRLYVAFNHNDATLIEVNPLIVTSHRRVVALDAKVTIDGAALFRHEELAAIEDPPEDPQERLAKEKGLTYVKLDGNVGILGNGAGLCMSTLDVVANAGGAPANFLDAGGGSKADAIVDALEVITSDPKVTAVLFNIFGGITRCDEVAQGIIEAYRARRHGRAAGRPPRRHQLRGGPAAARRGEPRRASTTPRRCSAPPSRSWSCAKGSA